MNFHDRPLVQPVRPALLGYLPDLQGRERLEALQAFAELGCSRVVEDIDGGLQHAADSLGPGDILVVPRLDALGSSLKAAMALLVRLSSAGIHVRAAREGIDTREEMHPAELCRLFLEAQDARRRTRIRSGMSEAKRRGEAVGRPCVLRREDVLAFRQLIAMPGMTVRKAADSLGLNVSTVRKRARALGIRLREGQDPAAPPPLAASPVAAVPVPPAEPDPPAELDRPAEPDPPFEAAKRRPGRPRALRAQDVVAFRQLVEGSGLSIKQAAATLGVSERALRRWARDLGIGLRRRVYTVRSAPSGPSPGLLALMPAD